MSSGVDRRIVLKGATTAMIMALLRGEHASAGAAAASGGSAARAPGALSAAATRVYAANQTVTPLIPGRLYRVGCIVRAERLSWLPADLDAYEPLNAYLLIDDKDVVFAEMGAPVMQPAIKSALSLIGDRKVWVWFSRNEADCIGNMGYVLGTCRNPTLLFGSGGGVLEWVNDPAVAITEVRDFLGRIPVESARNGVSKQVGSLNFKFMDAGSKQMFLTQWAFEESTGTLFTSESFGFRHASSVSSPTVIESASGLPSRDAVAKELVARFNWMRESSYPEITERFEKIFKEHDVQMLAPVHGAVIKGRKAVDAHVKLALSAMHAAAKLPDTERLQYV
jgi:hypothetical protein